MFDSAASWTTACQALLSSTISWSLFNFMSTESVMLSNHLILGQFFLPLPSVFSRNKIARTLPRAFPESQLFEPGGQSFGASASAIVLSMNIQDWLPLGLTGLISLQSKGPSRVFSNTTVQKHQFFSAQLSLLSNSHMSSSYMTTGKTIALTVLCLVDLLCPTLNDPMDCSTGCHFLLEGIFPTQGLNPCLLCLLHWQTDSLPLCHLGSQYKLGRLKAWENS